MRVRRARDGWRRAAREGPSMRAPIYGVAPFRRMVPRAHPFALRSGLSIVLCIALILTNLPQAAARFVATGHWPSAEGVAFAAQTTTTRASLTNAGAQANGPSVTLTGGDTLQEVRRYVSDDG